MYYINRTLDNINATWGIAPQEITTLTEWHGGFLNTPTGQKTVPRKRYT